MTAGPHGPGSMAPRRLATRRADPGPASQIRKGLMQIHATSPAIRIGGAVKLLLWRVPHHPRATAGSARADPSSRGCV